MNQIASIKVIEGHADRFQTGRKMKSSCCQFPTLFKLYVEYMMRNILAVEEAMSIGARIICCLRFVDDMVILTDETVAIQIML